MLSKITSVGDEPRQRMNVTLQDGSQFVLKLAYMQTQNGWFCDIEYGNKAIRGMRVVMGFNFLNQFRYYFPFGLICGNPTVTDPMFIDDFATVENCAVYLIEGKEDLDFYGSIVV